MKRPFYYFALILLSLFAVACGDNVSEKNRSNSKTAKRSNHFELNLNSNGSRIVRGDSVYISISPLKEGLVWDSVQVRVGGQILPSIKTQNGKALYKSNKSKVGALIFKANIYKGDTLLESVRKSLTVLSNVAPVVVKYEKIAELNHDRSAFTQGLFYHNKILFEGTGMKGSSQLRKVNIETGEVLFKKNISSSLFGEGITHLNGSIFQLTWKAGLALVYDIETFEEQARFHYNGDGWGITNDTSQLIMSDGTQTIKFIDPLNFSIIREINVCDDNGPIGFINELEYIEGKIFANVWQQDFILIIDPISGIVEGKINLSKLYPSNQKKPGVLNGIAYNPDSQSIYVTGKNWPYLYELKLNSDFTSF